MLKKLIYPIISGLILGGSAVVAVVKGSTISPIEVGVILAVGLNSFSVGAFIYNQRVTNKLLDEQISTLIAFMGAQGVEVIRKGDPQG